MAGDWWIFQHQTGQRYSTDDVLTAWAAVRAAPAARRVLDLGAGVGSVGLLTLLKLEPRAHLTAIEIQTGSAALLRKTVDWNGLARRVEVRLGDLRDSSKLDPTERYDLVTANPPFLPSGRAIRSPSPARAAARLELHGDVFDFCRIAARHLADAGTFVFCHLARDERVLWAIREAGLTLTNRQDILFREGRSPVIALHTCARQGSRTDQPPLAVRQRDGQRTPEMRKVRVEMLIDEA